MLGVLSGCAVVVPALIATAPPADTYSYAGKSYEFKQDALAAAKANHDDLIVKTRTAAERVGGTLNFYVPDKPAIMHRGFTSAKPLSENVKDYRAEAWMMQHKSLYDTVVKRGSFDSVVLHYSTGKHIVPQSGERVVYFYLSGPEEGAWYFSSRASSGTLRRGQLGFSRKEQRFERVESWLERIDSLARQ